MSDRFEAFLRLMQQAFLTLGKLGARLAEGLRVASAGVWRARTRLVIAAIVAVAGYGLYVRPPFTSVHRSEVLVRINELDGSTRAYTAGTVLVLPEIHVVRRYPTRDQVYRPLLDRVDERPLSALLRSRLHARRAIVWSSVAYGQARRGDPPGAAAQRALAELLVVHPDDLGDDRRAEYLGALVRVAAIRWAAVTPAPLAGPLTLAAVPGEPGQTCLTLTGAHALGAPLVRRCTYGIVWSASAQSIAQGRALVLAVQPLESWRELWVFHASGARWTVDVLSPGADDPQEGYVDFAGFVPGTRRLLIAREVREHGHFRRRFEELRLDDLARVREASTPELLADFGRWQDVAWRHDTLALH